MNKVKKFLEILTKLRFILTPQQKKKSIKVFFCIIISSLLELLSVTAILPFIYAMLEPEKIIENKYVQMALDALGIEITSSNAVIYYMGAVIIIVFILRSAALVLANYVRLAFENDIMKSISDLMMNSYMCRPYEDIVNINSAEAIRGIGTSATSVYYMLQNFFLLVSNALNIILLAVFLIYIDIVMALELVAFGGLFLALLLLFTQRKIRRSGADFNSAILYLNQYVSESFNGMKEITVLKRKNYFMNRFEKITNEKRKAELRFRFIQYYPNVVIQTICICLVVFIACVRMHQGLSSEQVIPSLATFAYGAIKILPAVSAISSSISGVLYYYDSFNDAYNNIYSADQYQQNKKNRIVEDDNLENAKPINFKNLEIRNLTWRYANTKVDVLKNLNLIIHRGECIGLIGKSGAGKSTLADIILGLLKPETDGCVMADHKDIFSVPNEWSHTVGYVPQKVFLMDDTIKNNILFGAAETIESDQKLWHALEQAQLKDFVEGLPEQLATVIGEGGAKLSGGQRQRIAIARALFNDPELLILDEATSALDNETEKAVMESIDYLQGKKTMLIIAHRLSTIENCDKVYEIVNGKAVLQV